MIPDGSLGADLPHDWIGRAICKVSKGVVCHIKQYLLGCTFERTLWWVGYWWRSGILVTPGYRDADFVGYPDPGFKDHELKSMLSYWLCELREGTPYNVPKLLGMYLVQKNEAFFKRLGWVPFQGHGLGDLCSMTVDKALAHAQIDAVPNLGLEFATPQDLLNSLRFVWYRTPNMKLTEGRID
jgi:hypothetical protein